MWIYVFFFVVFYLCKDPKITVTITTYLVQLQPRQDWYLWESLKAKINADQSEHKVLLTFQIEDLWGNYSFTEKKCLIMFKSWLKLTYYHAVGQWSQAGHPKWHMKITKKLWNSLVKDWGHLGFIRPWLDVLPPLLQFTHFLSYFRYYGH